MQVKVVVHEAEEGGFWAEVPALPGCVSQGETMDELLANIREAIQAWLATEPPVESGEELNERHRAVELTCEAALGQAGLLEDTVARLKAFRRGRRLGGLATQR